MRQADQFRRQLLERHAAAISNDQDPPHTVLVVAHNAILRCLLLALLDLPISGFRRLRVDNCSISVLNVGRSNVGRSGVQVELVNGLAHLGEPLPIKGDGARLLLVRHGETDWNREGRFQGQIDIPLNATGRCQAEAAGRFLAPVTINRAYTSCMARPRQTAEAILASHPGVPLTSSAGLVEIGHGLWEGRLEQDIAAGWPELLANWKRAPHTVQMPEGETLQEVSERSLGTWQRIAASLGLKNVMILRNHGLLTCGASIAEAFSDLYHLETACQIQIAAQSSGARLGYPSDALSRHTAMQRYEEDGSTRARVLEQYDILWAAMKRWMREISPGFDE